MGGDWQSIDLGNPTEEHSMLRDMIRSFVVEEVEPQAMEYDKIEKFNQELFRKLGDYGLLGISVPEKYGGSGMDATAVAIVNEELSYSDPGFCLAYLAHAQLMVNNLAHNGSDEQKSRILPKVCSGEWIGCMAMSEPGYGTDVLGMQTTAEMNSDGNWVINGRKMWITNGSIADVAVVWAKDEGGIIRGFLIEKGMKGFSANDLHGKLSLRASITSELSFNNVRVPDSSRLPNIEGLKGPLSCLTQARYGIAWGMVGAATDCYNIAVNYSKDRKQFSKPIAGYQLTQAKLAEMATKITEAQLLVYRLGQLKDINKMTFQQVSMAKRNNCSIARDIARTSREILGGNGIMGEYSPIRHMVNIESVYTYEGTHEMHTLILGQEITGIPAYDN